MHFQFKMLIHFVKQLQIYMYFKESLHQVCIVSKVEDPWVEDGQTNLFLDHLPPQMPSSIPTRYATPNDNEKTKHQDYLL